MRISLFLTLLFFSTVYLVSQNEMPWPSNDDFKDARDLGHVSAAVLEGSLLGATLEAGEPGSPGVFGSVWYKLTAAVSGRISSNKNTEFELSLFQMKGDSFEDLLGLPAGVQGSYLYAGQRYAIAIASKRSSGPFFYQIKLVESSPVNDHFANAADLGSSTNYYINGSAEGATREPGEPYNPNGVASVWYKWAPAYSGRVRMRVPVGDAHVSLYRAQGPQFTDLVNIGREDENPYVTTGETYYIGVYDQRRPISGFAFSLDQPQPETIQVQHDPPANDQFQNAIRLEGPSFSLSGSNVGASREVNERLAADDASGATVWYSWVAPFQGRGYLSWGTVFNPLKVGLYRGSQLENLQRITGPFDFEASETYYIQVDTPTGGWPEAFQMSMTSQSFTASNDSFAEALPMDELSTELFVGHAFLKYATRELGEPDHVSFPNKTVWWRFQPPRDGEMSVLGRSFTAQARVTVAVYQGESLDQLTLLGQGESFLVNVRAGAHLRIAVVVPEDGNEEVFCDLRYTFGENDPRLAQSIAWTTLPDVTLASSPIVLNASASSGLPVSYMVYIGPATVDGNTLTLTGPGTVQVGCSQFGDSNYKQAGSLFRTFNVLQAMAKVKQTIAFDPVDTSTSKMLLSATASSGLPVQFELVSGTATLIDQVLTVAGAESVTIRAVQAGNEIYEPANPVYQTFLVQRMPQTIELIVFAEGQSGAKTLTSVPSDGRTLGIQEAPGQSRAYVLNAAASSALPVVLSIVSGSATLQDTHLTVTGSQEVIVRAAQPGDTFFLPVSIDQTIVGLGRKSQTITFTSMTEFRFGDAPVALLATASSGLPVVFEKLAGPATVSGNLLSALGAGTVVVRASQSGNDQYEAAPAVDQAVTVKKAMQTIELSAPSDLSFSTNMITLNAHASSGLRVQYQLTDGPGVLADDVLTVTGSGTIKLRASQSGNDDYEGAAAEEMFSVSKGQQTIRLVPLPSLQFGDVPIELSATASSGLGVDFEVVSGPIRTAGHLLTVTGAGSASLRAVQRGDENYLPTAVLEEFSIKKATQKIQFQPPEIVFGGTVLPLDAMATSGLSVALTVVDGAAELKANLLFSGMAGALTIEATQDGDANFEAAESIRRTLTVLELPKISILRRDGTSVVLSWPQENPAFKLYTAESLEGPWQQLEVLPANATQFNVEPSVWTRFYRLELKR